MSELKLRKYFQIIKLGLGIFANAVQHFSETGKIKIINFWIA
jgi:hypothetical protein